MLSKAKIHALAAFARKKERDSAGIFVAEGVKLVTDLLPHFECLTLVSTDPGLLDTLAHRALQPATSGPQCECCLATPADMERITCLVTPSPLYALFRRRSESDLARIISSRDAILALDGVRDPGNLGTIIRTADWFGFRTILCSPDTADLYNPKVVQATMGAIARVGLLYADLPEAFARFRSAGWQIAGTFLGGENLYTAHLDAHHIIYVMGNEGQGISNAVASLVNRRLLIPPYPADAETSESLNVATATAILLSEIRRR